MNLTKLFETQRKLDERIVKEKGLEGQDLLSKKVLALLTELGELSNEWQGFKFWKENPHPRIEKWVECSSCDGTGDLNYETVQEDAEGSGGHEYMDCEECDSAGTIGTKNPLLEEYVDVLHFVLSIGNDLDITPSWTGGDYTEESTTGTFNELFETVGDLNHAIKHEDRDTLELIYEVAFDLFIGLGEKHLDFTTNQIETAYYEKNKINHARQENNY